jgi:hypothetical protein
MSFLIPGYAKRKRQAAEAKNAKLKRESLLSADDYVRDRLEEQIAWMAGRIASLHRQFKWLQIGILIVGGLGTFLAAMKHEVWVAFTTVLATAFANRLELGQVENRMVLYNVSLTSLRNIHTWWQAMSPWERTRRKNIDLLVDHTESTLERDTSAWVRELQFALDKLSEKESVEEGKPEKTPPTRPSGQSGLDKSAEAKPAKDGSPDQPGETESPQEPNEDAVQTM